MLRLRTYIWCMVLLTSVTGCSMIDEDLDNCAELNYDLQLVTNMTTELTTEMTTDIDIQLSGELRNHLGHIFSDYAHDVDLSFYDTKDDSVLLQKDRHIMDANQASYTLHLPMREYMHLATANLVENQLVGISGDDICHRSRLQQVIGDTIDSHTTGLFTGRYAMNVLGNVSQKFDVHLYMVNCAAALIVDTRNHTGFDDIRVFSTGFATGFNICDSVFQYSDHPPMVRTEELRVEGISERAYCSVTFPSPEPQEASTRNVIETEEPFIAEPGEETLWEFVIYVPQPDGTITVTRLKVKRPLRAGQLMLIRCWVGEHGAVVTQNPEVSTSVTLDWKPGLEIEGEE